MFVTDAPDALATERLEAEIVTLFAHIDSAMCRWLLLVAEFDRRDAGEAWECRTTAQWLSWRCGISPSTAREHVRVARALVELPVTTAAFASAELSYSKVRALVRVATPSTEAGLVEVARDANAAQLERIVASCSRLLDEARSDETLAAREARRGLDRSIDEHGMHVYVLRVPPEEGAVVDKALEQLDDVRYAEERAALKASGATGDDARPARVPIAQRRADAMMRLIEAGRYAALAPDAVPREQYVVMLHVRPGDARVGGDGLVHLGSDIALHPKVAARLGCDALVQLSLDDGDGSSLDLGREVRTATRKQRRALLAKYDTCVFPACQAPASWCEMHHLQYWTKGGPTDFENLTPVCKRHHRAVHEGGWRLVLDPYGRFDAIGPDGRYMWAGPPPTGVDAGCDVLTALDAAASIDAGAVRVAGTWTSGALDLDLAVGLVAERDERLRPRVLRDLGLAGSVVQRC